MTANRMPAGVVEGCQRLEPRLRELLDRPRSARSTIDDELGRKLHELWQLTWRIGWSSRLTDRSTPGRKGRAERIEYADRLHRPEAREAALEAARAVRDPRSAEIRRVLDALARERAAGTR